MNEQQLVLHLQQGSELAYRQIIQVYKEKILHTCLGFVSNLQDAEDLCQEVFIEIYRSIGKFRQDSKFSTWIYRITRTKALEFIRFTKRKKRADYFQSLIGLEENKVPLHQHVFDHPGVLLENKERAKIVFEHIEKLGQKQRQAFTLHKIEGRSQKEIALIMNTTVSSIEALLFRAKRNLKKQLEAYYRNQLI